MYTKIMFGGLVAIAATMNAMPSAEQIKKVEPIVVDLMKGDQSAMKNGKKTRVEVAESAMSLATKADSEAAKLLLMKGAFSLYVYAGEFDKAIETLRILQETIPDIPPANVVSIIEASLRGVSRKNGGQLYQILDETRTRIRYTNTVKKLERLVKQNSTDGDSRIKLAEHYAYLGKWDLAIGNFAKTDGKVGKIAQIELAGNTTEEAADFWWSYSDGKAEELKRCFRTHAVKMYGEMLSKGKISGLNKVQAERRIEEVKGYGEPIVSRVTVENDGLYCVLDLSAGPNASRYPVSYLKEAPKGGWKDEHKTNKLVLRKVPAGSDPLGRYSLSKGYYIAVFEMTQKQWELLTGKRPSLVKSDKLPVTMVSYADVCGENGITKKLSSLTRVGSFDLPTEAQWEFASRAGVKTRYACGDAEDDLKKTAWYLPNSGYKQKEVGLRSPNALGLYDMQGNVWERCRDFSSSMRGIDPVGKTTGTQSSNCGGSFRDGTEKCWHGGRAGSNFVNACKDRGFRIVLNQN